MVIGERVGFFSRVGPAEIIFCFGKVKGGGGWLIDRPLRLATGN